MKLVQAAHKQDYWTCYQMETMIAMRLHTGTTIEAIAAKAGVTSEKVRSWENSPLPDITLAQLYDYALACGYAAHDIVASPLHKQAQGVIV